MTKMNLYLVAEDSGGRTEVVKDDRELAEAARNGDEEAFGDLVRRHSGGLHRTVSRVLSDETEGWDVVQMTFLKAWQRLDRYNTRWSFATWLYRIGINLAIDVLRARSSRERAHQAGSEHRLRLVGDGERACGLSDSREIDRVLGQLVVTLTPQQRAAFVLREVDGMETAEAARIMGCSATTVRNHIFQARKVLRREMQRRFPEYVPPAKRNSHAQ